jgi:hypothetical protein
MPTFDTPQPITVELDLVVGDARVIASDRTDTVVDVRPTDIGNPQDRKTAEQTTVEFTGGLLLVRAPKQRSLSLFNKVGSIDVRVEIPTGSELRAKAAVAAVHCQGGLGRCRVKTSSGDVQVEDSGPLEVETSIGGVDIGHVTGDAEVNTGSGKVRIAEVEGSAVVKNSNGNCTIGRVAGDLRASTANGDVVVDQAGGDVHANTANGEVRVGEVVRGSVSLKTALGAIDVGIRSGTAAQLDAHTSFGRVLNHLETVDGPGAAADTVHLTARTSYGDIVIRRA